MKRDLISIQDLSREEVKAIMDSSLEMKKNKGQRSKQLDGKTIALLFQKPSNRTRVSFEVGIWQLGGNCLYLGPSEINLGKRESTYDVAKTLSRYLNGIVARTYSHEDIVELGKQASVPVINGLSDLLHPCQGLTDIFSVIEKFGYSNEITVSFVGDGNNVCHSLMLGCAKVGFNIHVATPQGYEPNKDMIIETEELIQETGARLSITNSPEEAVEGAHVIYSDVWVSMGQEDESKKREKKFKDFQVNTELAKLANKDYIFMHCLPAHREMEVSAEIIDGPHSIVFEQAENRMHVQKAILNFLTQ